MHSKSSFTYLRLIMLALTGVSAILLALVFVLHKSGAAPAVQGKTTLGKKAQSRRASSRHDSKVDAFLSQPSVRSSLDEIKLTDPAGEELDLFGWTVAISGTTAVVGNSVAVMGTVERKVLIFVRRGDVWELQQTLSFDPRLPDPHIETPTFPLAIDKGTLVIGVNAAAYVYVRTGTTWSLQTTFLSPVSEGGDIQAGFGQAVAVSGDTVIVGAAGVDNGAGAVYFYERSGATWSGPLQVSADDRSPGPPNQRGDLFGWAVAIEGDTAVVTAPCQVVVETNNIIDEQGAAYVYVRSLGTWVEQGYLTPNEDVVETTEHMGNAVDLSGDTLVAGVGDSDHAFVFARQGTAWTEQQILTAFDGLSGDGFGNSVGISGDQIVVGSPGNDNDLGAAYLYERTGATWFEGDKLRATTGVPTFGHLFFGGSVAISGDTIIAGAPSEEVGLNDLQGAAYLFQRLDTDGDGLPDEWETNGVTIEGEFINLPAMGANPMHKDLFIHLDWMQPSPGGQTFDPNPRSFKFMIDAFADAPVENPDGKDGINLHLDAGPDSIMNPITRAEWGELSQAGDVPFQEVIDGLVAPEAENVFPNWPSLDAIKMARFSPARRNAIFHYVLYCNSYSAEDPSVVKRGGRSRGIPSTDLILAIGSRPLDAQPITEASLLMHEFGHNLGLRHGGSDGVNNKPNYISIMNYRFDLIGTLRPDGRQRYIDYSREELDPLDENDGLNENIGINDSEMHLTTWNPLTRPDIPPGSNKCVSNPDSYYRLFYPDAALDWDCDGAKNPAPVMVDINGDGELTRLTSFNDWAALVYDGAGRKGNKETAAVDRLESTGANKTNRQSIAAAADTADDELTIDELRALVPPALLAEELVAPLDVVTFSNPTGGAPLPVSFDGSASTAVNGTIVNWQWDFGDGSTGSGASVAHNYATAGVYFASLTVTDSNGRVNLLPLRHRVTVTNEHPNLTPFQPPSWSDKIVVSNVTGANADSAELTTNDVLYVDWAVINNGVSPTTADFSSKLYVDDVEVLTSLTNAPLEVNSYTAVQDFAIGPLSAGPHTIRIVADANGAIFESDEFDNEYSRVINISGAGPTPSPTPTGQPNLTPYQPPSWSDKIVVANVTGTNADSAPLNTTDTLYVDWAAINNGGAPTPGTFDTKLYVDGVERNTRVTSVSINPGGSFGVQDLTIGSLSAGQHTVRVVLDSGGVITESDETDNEYSKTITVVSPLPTPSPTPTPLPVSQTYTVRNTNDSGPDSLRQAIIDANNHPNAVGGIDQIAFNIPGPGVHTITPATAYPAIADPVLIDGYTQPGASVNTLVVGDDAVLLIELNGVNISEEGLVFTGGNSTIRGLVINHFDSNLFSLAIRLGSSNNVVAGNFIGTNASGTSGVRNLISVKIASGANNLIGGTTPADRNILGGANNQNEPAAGAGVQILTTQPGTRVQGNYIGTNAAGNAALGNGRGIDLVGSTSADITIGGLTDTPGTGAGNVISGNSSNGGINSYGIYIAERPGDLRIQGNLIGLNATGTTAVSNGVSGIHLEDATPGTSLLLVGGTEPGARNVIFNNKITGILSNAIGLIVQGNFIGTDITGMVRLSLTDAPSSQGDAITIGGGSVLIGGDSAAARNVISSLGRGLRLAAGSTTVQGNYLGTAVDGSTPLGNLRAGVLVQNDAVAMIGGTAPGQGNLIAHSFRAGIEIRNTARVAILGNSIFDNGTQDVNTFQGHPGIDLNDNGVTPNDSCDTDSGPNGLQNFPVLISAVRSAANIKFIGSLNSKSSTSFRVEFLSNPTCEASGHGEGQTYVGWTTVSTGESCSASINVTLPSAVPVGQFISATATDPDGNTSEFGPCVQVTAGAPPTAADGSVSGQIVDTHGNAIAGVAISLTGTQNRLTITDGNGRYNFDNVETNGFYTVVPARTNYSFSPAQRSFTALGIQTDAGFTATSMSGGLNPLDATEYFVRQQYLDFLGREPDESGLNFWSGQIASCGNDTACVERKRINVSAAYFLSIEFQKTGGVVDGLYRASYERRPLYAEFLSDTANIARDVVVGRIGWEQQLAANKRAFIEAWVQRPAFAGMYGSVSNARYVDDLISHTRVTFSQSERGALLTGLENGTLTRAAILQGIVDDERFVRARFNEAFVTMQYFGYLRRDPDESGYRFWLAKLRQFNGDFEQAEMVKAFLLSGEYRTRFGP